MGIFQERNWSRILVNKIHIQRRRYKWKRYIKYVTDVAIDIVAEVYVRKCMNILIRRTIKETEGNNMADENVLTEEQKQFRELLQDLLMEQQEQM